MWGVGVDVGKENKGRDFGGGYESKFMIYNRYLDFFYCFNLYIKNKNWIYKEIRD